MKFAADIRSLPLVIQFVISIFASLLLDGGYFLYFWLAASSVFWLAVWGIYRKRFGRVTRSDLHFIRFGLLLIFALLVVLSP